MMDELIAILIAPPANPATVVLWAVIGLIIGSFLNVVIHRLPVMMQRESDNYVAAENDQPPVHTERYNLLLPRSACPACGHSLSALENIPLISFLWLRGRCRHCQTPISSRYPIVELCTAALTALVAWRMGTQALGLASLVMLWFLIAMSCIDFDTQILPDDLTLPLLWLGLLVNLRGGFVPLQDAVIGAAAGYLSLWLVYWLFRFVTGKEGIGYGDFKLLAALGAWLGWIMLPLIVLLSSAIGAIVGLLLIALRGHARDKPIPFGPFLAMAGLVALLAGDAIVQFYLNKLT